VWHVCAPVCLGGVLQGQGERPSSTIAETVDVLAVHLYKKQGKNENRVGKQFLTVTSRDAHGIKRETPLLGSAGHPGKFPGCLSLLALAHDVVALEDAARPVPADLHGHPLGNTGPSQPLLLEVIMFRQQYAMYY